MATTRETYSSAAQPTATHSGSTPVIDAGEKDRSILDQATSVLMLPLAPAATAVQWIKERTIGGSGELVGSSAAEAAASFSPSYADAREKFVELGSAAGAEMSSVEVLSGYSIDFALFAGAAGSTSQAGTVVHMSGTHGVEGFAGSAIQCALLRGGKESVVAKSAQAGTTVVLVHAVNPFGFAHHRRWNENNVDLNRNMLRESDWEEALGRSPSFAGYAQFDGLLNPPSVPSWFEDKVSYWGEAAANIAKHGYQTCMRATVTGQYHKPEGIFYGGKELQKSHTIVQTYLREHGVVDSRGPVTVIDVHTGLGPCGVDTLMSDEPPAQLNFVRPAVGNVGKLQVLSVKSDDANEKVTIEDDQVGASAYSVVKGTTNDMTRLFNNPDAAPVVVVQEFGTVPGVLVLQALRFENACWHYGTDEDKVEGAKRSKSAFYVDSDDWRTSVVTRGVELFSDAAQRSMQ